MSKHGLYNSTPEIKRDADGKLGVHKSEKKEPSEDKGGMLVRHEKEVKEMNTRHEKEAGATAGSADVGAPLKEIEKGAK